MNAMKHIYHVVTIPAGSFLVAATSGNGRKLDYLDFFDRAILRRYFAPGDCQIEPIPAREAHKLEGKMPRATFQGLQKYGTWR